MRPLRLIAALLAAAPFIAVPFADLRAQSNAAPPSQTESIPPAPRGGGPAPPPTPPGAGTASEPIVIPEPPSVNDPMLDPVPPPAHVVTSWEEALQIVRARSTDLRTAYDDVLRAEAQQRIALAGALPTLSANGSYTRNLLFKDIGATTSAPLSVPVVGADGRTTVGFTQPFTTQTPASRLPNESYASGSLNAAQPVLALRSWYALGTTRSAKIASELTVEDLKRTLALGVANALVGVVTAERIAELNRIGFRSALERLELTTRKQRLGAANGLDVVRVQQDVEAARAVLVTGDESLRQSRESLGLALGMPEQVGVAASIRIDGLEDEAKRSCRVSDSIDARADVRASRQRVDVAKRNVDDVWLQFAPTVTATSSLATSTIETVLAPKTTWNIQALLTIPLFDGGVRYGELRDTRAQVDQAEQSLEGLKRAATIQVVQARRNVSVAEDSRKVAENTRALAAEVDRLTQTGYREGQGTSLDLVIAASALRQAEVDLALKEFGLVQARVLAILALADCPW